MRKISTFGPALVAWVFLLIGVVHATLALTGHFDWVPQQALALVVSAAGGLGVVLLGVALLAGWVIAGLISAQLLSLLSRRAG